MSSSSHLPFRLEPLLPRADAGRKAALLVLETAAFTSCPLDKPHVRTFFLDSVLRAIGREFALLEAEKLSLEVYTPGPCIALRSCTYFRNGLVEIVQIVHVRAPSEELQLERLSVAVLAAQSATKALSLRTLSTLLDRHALREFVKTNGGIAFIANGSILTSESSTASIVPFQSPPTLETEFTLPYSGQSIIGMLIPAGVTVITGGGFHGKSTLLRALAMGCHDFCDGDGRALCVTIENSTTIRSEDGRSVSSVDISQFIANLPKSVTCDPTNFSTSNASGSTSQAAGVMEGLEAGSSLFLLDEDTCAGNFMIRDSRLRSLIEHDPITPFIYRVNSLHLELNISTLVVIGGSGDWFDVQDHTLQLDNYECKDVTKRVAQISKMFCTGRVTYNGKGLVHQLPWSYSMRQRLLDRSCFRSEGAPFLLTASEDGSSLKYGQLFTLDLSKIEQRVEGSAGALGIGVGLYWVGSAATIGQGRDECTIAEILYEYEKQRHEDLAHSFSALTCHEIYLLPHPTVLAAAICRVRGARFRM